MEPKIGARVRFVAGDLIGETAIVRSGPQGRWQLYSLELESDGTPVEAARDRFVIVETTA